MNNFLKSMIEWFQNIYMAVFNTAEITAMRAGQQEGALRQQLQMARGQIGALSRQLAGAEETIYSQERIYS